MKSRGFTGKDQLLLLQDLCDLGRLFPDGSELIEEVELLSPSDTPEPYRALLDHENHMTVTMEQFHQCSVDVHVIFEEFVDPLYNREILLTRSGTNQVVQFGLVRFDFTYVTPAVKNEILAKRIPLGRVLIRHNVLRHINLRAILKIVPGPALQKQMQLRDQSPVYGRMATIFCNDRPAVDLLEVASPIPNPDNTLQNPLAVDS